MELEYDYWTGSINQIKDTLSRSIGQYKVNNIIKVGITSNPEARFSAHRRARPRWKRMVVKYETSSVRFINDLERILIDRHWNDIVNQRGGGGGPNGNPPYYLYVLLR